MKLWLPLVEGQRFERKRVSEELHDNLGSTIEKYKISFAIIRPCKILIQKRKIFFTIQNMDKHIPEVS
jgi:hypothetical protein